MVLELILLLFIPLIFGLGYLVAKKTQYKLMSYALLIINSLLAVLVTLQGTQTITISGSAYTIAEGLIMAVEAAIVVFLLVYSYKHKRILTLSLVVVQLLLLLYPIFFMDKEHEAIVNVDKLSLVMLLIINIVGSLIVVFANNYIEEYEHHRHMKSKQKSFFFIICAFLFAMNGLVISDSLGWVYFFWEITTIASFLLIGFNGDKEAYNSAFRAVTINLFGGICFGLGNILLRSSLEISTLSQLTEHGKAYGFAVVPVFFLCLAGFTKAAQVPFQSWLLGAMVAPTPVSALLHSSTMVKAGVYLIIKLAPAYAGTGLGTAIAIYGAFVFVICSAIAISQSNAKRVLAYSTIANLGLIICSAGLGTTVGVAAAIVFLIFHAVSKALLFLCTGQIEHTINSRDIEDMSGLVGKAPVLAWITAFGILSMILPPFGVLVTKWLILEASASSPIIVIMLALGSALTTLYYIKWIGNLLASPTVKTENKEHKEFSIYAPLAALGLIVTAISIFIAPLYNGLVAPEIKTLLGADGEVSAAKGTIMSTTGAFNNYIVVIAVAVLLVVFLVVKNSKATVKGVYMCGENNSADGYAYFRQGNDTIVESKIGNFYLDKVFNEKYLTLLGYGASITLLILMVAGGLL